MKKILGFSGSPRKHGNTGLLVEKILSGAKEKGAETKLFNLAELKISGCQSCFYCKSNEGCAVKDDMQELIKEIKSADALVIGSPIYMWQMTSLTKAFVERLYTFWKGPSNSKLSGKECILAFTHGMPAGAFQPYIESTAKMLEFAGLKVKGTIVAGNANNGISGQTDLLIKAYNMGQALAEQN